MIEKELSRIAGILEAREKATQGEWTLRGLPHAKDFDEHTLTTAIGKPTGDEWPLCENERDDGKFVILAANEIESLAKNYRKALNTLKEIVDHVDNRKEIHAADCALLARQTLRDICGDGGE